MALLPELLQGSSAGLLLLLEREDMAVEAGGGGTGGVRWGPEDAGLCRGWRLKFIGQCRGQGGLPGGDGRGLGKRVQMTRPSGAHQSVILRIFCPICSPQ